MGTRKVKLTGYGYWMKLFEGNRDLTGFNNQLADIGGQCVMDIDLSQEEYDKLKKAKFMSAGKPSPDNPGHMRVRLKRKWQEEYGGGAPVVLKEDGTVWDYDEDGGIGNGSTVAAIVYVYDTKTPGIVGARLDKVKVLEHKPYVQDDFGDDDPAPPAPAPRAETKVAKPVKPAPSMADLEDDIPF
jgi:hypothetical protein